MESKKSFKGTNKKPTIEHRIYNNLSQNISNHLETGEINVFLNVNHYAGRSFENTALADENCYIVIFSLRFIHNGNYVPLLAIKYYEKHVLDEVATNIAEYWQNILTDLLNLRFNVIASLSSAHRLFRKTVKRLCGYKFTANARPIKYRSEFDNEEIVHIFDITSINHYLEALLKKNYALHFLQVDRFGDPTPSVNNHTAYVPEIEKVLRGFLPELYATEELVTIFLPYFFYNFYYISIHRTEDSELRQFSQDTSLFLSLCCPYVRMIDSINPQMTADTLIHLSNNLCPLKIFLSTVRLQMYSDPHSDEPLNLSMSVEDPSENVQIKDEFEAFEMDYKRSVFLEPIAGNNLAYSYAIKCELQEIFNQFRTIFVTPAGTSSSMFDEFSAPEQNFETKLSISLYNDPNIRRGLTDEPTQLESEEPARPSVGPPGQPQARITLTDLSEAIREIRRSQHHLLSKRKLSDDDDRTITEGDDSEMSEPPSKVRLSDAPAAIGQPGPSGQQSQTIVQTPIAYAESESRRQSDISDSQATITDSPTERATRQLESIVVSSQENENTYLSVDTLTELREAHNLMPDLCYKHWLFNAWLQTINAFPLIAQALITLNTRNEREYILHSSCLNNHHIDELVEGYKRFIKSREMPEGLSRPVHPLQLKNNICYEPMETYYSILEADLVDFTTILGQTTEEDMDL